MTKLSPTQRSVLGLMESGVWYTAYDLQVSLSTLNALHKAGIVSRKSGNVGEIFSPRTIIKFKRVEAD